MRRCCLRGTRNRSLALGLGPLRPLINQEVKTKDPKPKTKNQGTFQHNEDPRHDETGREQRRDPAY